MIHTGAVRPTMHAISGFQCRTTTLIPASRISPTLNGRKPEVVTAAKVPGMRGLCATAGHGRQDHERVGLADRRVQTVEDADVLVVEIDVDIAVQRPVDAEELRLGGGVLLGERAQDRADVLAAGLHLLLAAHRGTQNRWNLD